MSINRAWHEKNKMAKNPSDEERMNWHIEHVKNCACRRPSAKLLAEMKKIGFKEVKISPKLRSKK
jgi:hypothetical protein